MPVELGNRVLFVRGGKAFEGRVFAVREGACSVEGPGNRPFYLEHWEILLVLGFDEEYARWLSDPLDEGLPAARPAASPRRREAARHWGSCRPGL